VLVLELVLELVLVLVLVLGLGLGWLLAPHTERSPVSTLHRLTNFTA
jgi:hypothetical protein